MTRRRPSLALRVALHVAAFVSVLFLVNQMLQAYRALEYRYHLDINIAHWATREIIGELEVTPRIALRDEAALDYYARPEAPLNAFRIIDPATNETLLAGGNRATLDRLDIVRHDLRLTALEVEEAEVDGRELIWGIVRHVIGGRELIVEVAIDRQTRGLRRDAFIDELVVDLHLGWLIALVGVVLLVYLSIRSGLAPLVEARRALRAADPLAGPPTGIGRSMAAGQGGAEVDTFLDDLRDTFERQGAILRAQQEFVGRAAHELRTPLTMMALDLATIDDERARAVEADVHDLAGKIGNMLAWARMDADADTERGAVDLGAIARRVVAGLDGLAAQKDVTVVVDQQGPALAEGDPASIEEAVRNLVENAIRHGYAESTVTVHCGPGGRISVEDEGPGFGTADPQLLCRPFWKGKASTAGSGLGLALVKRVADRHGATLEFGGTAAGGGLVTLNFKAFQPQNGTHSTDPVNVKHVTTFVK